MSENWRIVPGNTSVEELARMVREEQEQHRANMEKAKAIARQVGEHLARSKMQRAIDGLREPKP